MKFEFNITRKHLYILLALILIAPVFAAVVSHTAEQIRAGVFGQVWSGNWSFMNGSVGIGTTEPGASLHVIGDGSNIQLKLERTTDYTGSGVLYANSYYPLALKNDSGDEVFVIEHGGNVGIGTTSPRAKLDVNGSYAIEGQKILSYDSGNSRFTFGDLLGGDGVVDELYFRTHDTDQMVIDSGGNVGIGTTNPGAKLDVNGTIHGWNVPSDIKVTNTAHNGNFGGYASMKTWIQSHDCNGYHVCDNTEITRWLQSGGSNPGSDCWYNSGLYYLAYTDRTVTDCNSWSSASTDYWGPKLMIGNLFGYSRCDSSYAVCCCK